MATVLAAVKAFFPPGPHGLDGNTVVLWKPAEWGVAADGIGHHTLISGEVSILTGLPPFRRKRGGDAVASFFGMPRAMRSAEHTAPCSGRDDLLTLAHWPGCPRRTPFVGQAGGGTR